MRYVQPYYTETLGKWSQAMNLCPVTSKIIPRQKKNITHPENPENISPNSQWQCATNNSTPPHILSKSHYIHLDWKQLIWKMDKWKLYKQTRRENWPSSSTFHSREEIRFGMHVVGSCLSSTKHISAVIYGTLWEWTGKVNSLWQTTREKTASHIGFGWTVSFC